MSETITEMRARHDSEIAQLQDNCAHKEISEWMRYMWAPGHYGGHVKVCSVCGKTIEKSNNMPIVDDVYDKGDCLDLEKI